MGNRDFVRCARLIYAFITLGFYLQIILVFGLTIAAGVVIFSWGAHQLAALPWLPYPLQVGFAGGITFVGVLFTLGLLVILLSRLFRLRATAGSYRLGSWPTVRWATYNFYTLLYRYSLMNFIRATPLQPWFYRLMGAKIGKGVQINSTIIADCNLLTIGDYTMIGGDAQVICHSYEHARLVIEPVTIGDYVNIGLNAVILPGVTIGDGATIAAGAVVPKNTVIPPKTLWAGVPARQIRTLDQTPSAS